MMHNSPEAWDALIAKYGPEFTIMGGASETFWESGEGDWRHVIRPHLEPLGDAPVILEWGAGIGRISRAGIADLPVEGTWTAYEPSAAALSVWDVHLDWPDAQGKLVCRTGVDWPPYWPPPEGFTHIFCWFTMHNIAYDDVWEFFGFCGQHLAPGGRLLFDYIDITSEIAQGFMRRKDGSEWPSYMWHPAQLEAMLRFQCPGIERVEVLDRPRRCEVWQRGD